MRFNNAPAPLTLRANRLRDDAAGAGRRGSRPTAVAVRPRPLRARRADRRRRASAARRRARCRAGSSCRTKRRSSSRCSPATHPGRARARHLRVAWRQDDGARGGDGRHAAARRLRRARPADRPAAADGRGDRRRRTCASCRRTCCSRCRSRAPFDCVLVDAPCSGLGTLRRDPDIRWRRREDDLAALAAARARRCCSTPRPRSRRAAVSSTRPVRASRRRTKAVVDAFLATAPTFAPVDARERAPAPAAGRSSTQRGHLRTAAASPRPRGVLRRGVRTAP